MKTAIKSEWVAPMNAPVIRGGAVVFEGEWITAVGRWGDLRGICEDARVIDAGDAIVMPGLVNAHTHLELSHLSADALPADDFVAWIKGVIRARREGMERSADWIQTAVKNGAAECLRFGVTCVGDITSQPRLSRPALAKTGLRGVSFGEVVALGKLRGQLESALMGAVDESCVTERLRIGVSPHAPYTVEMEGYRRCAEKARGQGMVLSTHLSETAFEAEFLRHQRGPFRELWESMGLWDGHVKNFDGTAIEYAAASGALEGAVVAHGNYCDARDIELLAKANAKVVYCPRTHAYFGHREHPFMAMMKRGVSVVIGTDSRASSPDLNLVDEIRMVHRNYPGLEEETLWRMVTVQAAEALGLKDVGALERGRRADLAVFSVASDQPLEELLENGRLPMSVWIGGKRM